MAIFSRFKPHHEASAVETTSPIRQHSVEDEKTVYPATQQVSADDESDHLQGGIKEADAITKLWSWKHLVAAYILIWVINFMVSALRTSHRERC